MLAPPLVTTTTSCPKMYSCLTTPLSLTPRTTIALELLQSDSLSLTRPVKSLRPLHATALPEMRIVGLTGGISSGKSTVSNIFKASDIPVVDADVVARDVLKKGTSGWKKVVKKFGEDILQPNGEVDRPKLGQIVFSDPSKRQLLNRLLAPHISSGIFQEVFRLWLKGSKVIVLDVPLLFEAKLDKWTNPVIVVWVDHETQLQRLKARDGISDEEAHNKINAQMPLDLKRSKADIVIDNNGTLEDLNEQVQKVLHLVTRPLTWREKLLSRQGVILATVCIAAGILLCIKFP
ncbi:hypothetical protein V2J09_016122 [Rumex salicifolius]